MAPAMSAWGGTMSQATGRLLLASVFFVASIVKFSMFDKETGGPLMQIVSPKIDNAIETIENLTGFDVDVPKEKYPQLLLTAAVMEAFGAALFLMDQRFGALVLIGYTTIATFVMHNFWDMDNDPVQQYAEAAHVLKNISIIGGLVYYLATSSGTRHKNKYELAKEKFQAEWEEERQKKKQQKPEGKKDS